MKFEGNKKEKMEINAKDMKIEEKSKKIDKEKNKGKNEPKDS